MYRNVIVGVDGGPGGREAAALSAALAVPGAFISLIFVSVNGAASVGLELSGDSELPTLLEEEVFLAGGDAQVQRVMALSVGGGLEDAAAGCGADLIVLGASRRNGVSRVLAGDDVKSVVHKTPCAVAVAPPDCGPKFALRRVGVAYDGSSESEVALAHGGLVAERLDATLGLRHVVTPRVSAPGWGMTAVPVDDSRGELSQAEQQFGAPEGLEIEHVDGLVGAELADYSDHVDLLVCGSRRHGTLRRIVEGSTSEYLTRHSRCPLLIAPALDKTSVERFHALRLAATA